MNLFPVDEQTPATATEGQPMVSSPSPEQNQPVVPAQTDVVVAPQNTLPVETNAPVASAENHVVTTVAAAPAGGKSILIIEDERPLAHALELKLGHSGFVAKAVNSGEAALEALAQGQFDIILLDLILPGMDGFELLQKIRETNQTVKIVVLSNLGQPEDKTKTEPFKITEYYIKSNVPLASVVQSLQTLS